MPLFAVHISDGFLDPQWLIGGLAVMILLGTGAFLFDVARAKWQGREVGEAEIALTGVMTAAFFVATLIKIPVGPTSVHLLFNGLLGVTLRWRAAIAIPIGLLFQAALFGHGAFSTLGVNSCIMVLPALLGWGLFAGIHRCPYMRQGWFRALLVICGSAVWTLCLIFSLLLLTQYSQTTDMENPSTWAMQILWHQVLLNPWIWGLTLALSSFLAWWEPKLENAPEFPLGLLLGIVTALSTVLLNCWILTENDFASVALLLFVAHVPVAVLEGMILGFTVGFLAKVKPALLGWQVQKQQIQATKTEAETSIQSRETCHSNYA